MPLRHVGNTEAEYYLVLFDADGNERREADESLLSQRLGEDIQDGVTDVFFASHGWKGDIPAAIRQYDSWVGTMAAQDRDRALARERYPGFKAMAVCVHWPSLPWGVEDAGAALLDDVDEFAAEQELSNGELVDMYAARIANTDAARSALAVILAGADDPETARQVAKSQLTPDLEAAYQTLFDEAGLSLGGPAAAPGLDHQNFTPATTISTWLPAAQNQPAPAFSPEPQPGLLSDGFRGAVRDALLMPVRQLSFWAMKHRARQVGETGVHTLLAGLQQAAPGTRYHLMGHSFGCIVVSAAIAGPITQGAITSRLPRPVNSLFLAQGALSLWSFAERLPFPPNPPGYFRPIDLAPAQSAGRSSLRARTTTARSERSSRSAPRRGTSYCWETGRTCRYTAASAPSVSKARAALTSRCSAPPPTTDSSAGRYTTLTRARLSAMAAAHPERTATFPTRR